MNAQTTATNDFQKVITSNGPVFPAFQSGIKLISIACQLRELDSEAWDEGFAYAETNPEWMGTFAGVKSIAGTLITANRRVRELDSAEINYAIEQTSNLAMIAGYFARTVSGNDVVSGPAMPDHFSECIQLAS